MGCFSGKKQVALCNWCVFVNLKALQMENTVVKKLYSFEEYWQMELQSEQRHEFIDGQIIAMPGVTKKHNLINGNLLFTCKQALKGLPYYVFMEAVKLQIASQKDYTYPDLCIAPMQGNQLNDLLIANPVLVAEVLSEGTKLYDKVDKFLRYKKVSTLQYYLLIDTDAVLVDVYQKLPDGEHWESKPYTQLSDMLALQLSEVMVQIPIAAIYEGVFG